MRTRRSGTRGPCASTPTDNDQLIAYSKRTPAGDDTLFVVVNLDPFDTQHGWVQVPLRDWGLAADATYDVVDLLSGERYTWRGEWNYVRLDPGSRPAHVLAPRL